MAAPMMSNNSLTKRTLRNLILCNFVIVLALLCLAYIPFNGNSHFDLISNSLSATKILSCFTLGFQVSLHMFLGTRSQKVKLGYWLKDLFRCFGIFFSSILSFHCLAVLFGAPFTQKTAETFHFAMMLSSAAVGPLLIHLETNIDAWIRVIACQSPDPGIETTAYLSCICSLVGAWLGAVPVPLDWDRPWQVWPITCVLGTLIGHCVGIVLSSVYMSLQFHKGKQFKIT